MRKMLILTMIMLSAPMILFSQDIGFENRYINVFEANRAVWKSCLEINSQEFENPISETILYGDTTINGINWKIFSTPTPDDVKGLVRTEDKKVILIPYPGYEGYYYYNGNPEEFVLYDFSLEVGDSFGSYGTVMKIDSIYLDDGMKHKRIFFNNEIRHVEGLGSDNYEPFYFVFPQPTSMSVSTLMCCHVNDELLYKNPVYLDCEGNKVGNEYMIKNTQKAKVTFMNGQIKVLFEDDNLFNVSVYNMQGLLVSKQTNARHKVTIQFESQANGIYFVKIVSGEYMYTQKIYTN